MNTYRIMYLNGTINYGDIISQFVAFCSTRAEAEATAEAMMPADCRSYAVYLMVD